MTYTQPLVLVCLLVLAAGLIRARRAKHLRLAWLGLFALFLLTLPAADWFFSRPLEAAFPVKPFSADSGQAIVVLSGGVAPPHFETPYFLPDKDTYERCQFAAWLYTKWRALPVLASGGRGIHGEQPFSEAMRGLLQSDGIPESMIWTEGRSRSTHENALYSAQLLRKKGINTIVLVTEAQSMMRAELCFRKEGLVVIPAPSSFREFGPLVEELMPSWKAISRNEVTLHETLGLVWYDLRGWI